MGTWGTKINENDDFLDTFGEFFDKYNKGELVENIIKQLIEENIEKGFEDDKENHSFWFALADAQYKCGKLDKQIFDKVKSIIESRSNIELWRELEASEKDIKAREKELDNFLQKLQIPSKKIILPKKKRISKAPYQKGDCIIYQGENDKWYGSVCLEVETDSYSEMSLILNTRICQEEKPTLKDFETCNILICNFASWDNSLAISWHSKRQKKQMGDFEIIGKIKIPIDSSFDANSYGGRVVAQTYPSVDLQLEYEKKENNLSPNYSLKEILERGIEIRKTPQLKTFIKDKSI